MLVQGLGSVHFVLHQGLGFRVWGEVSQAALPTLHKKYTRSKRNLF